jgi:hypothetical protein
MDKLQELKKWESTSANFFKGVELCTKHKIRLDLIDTFRDGATKGNKKLLLQILQKEIAKLSNKNDNSESETPNPHPSEGLRKVKLAAIAKLNENFGMRARYPELNLNKAPDFIKLMFSEALASWDETVKLHDEELMNADTDAERLEIMERLMAAAQANDAAHNELRHYNDTKEILGKHPKYSDFSSPSERTGEASDFSGDKTDPEDTGKNNPMSDLETKLREMDKASLLQWRNNRNSKISKVKAKIQNNPNNGLFKTELQNLESERNLANAILDEK